MKKILKSIPRIQNRSNIVLVAVVISALKAYIKVFAVKMILVKIWWMTWGVCKYGFVTKEFMDRVFVMFIASWNCRHFFQ